MSFFFVLFLDFPFVSFVKNFLFKYSRLFSLLGIWIFLFVSRIQKIPFVCFTRCFPLLHLLVALALLSFMILLFSKFFAKFSISDKVFYWSRCNSNLQSIAISLSFASYKLKLEVKLFLLVIIWLPTYCLTIW